MSVCVCVCVCVCVKCHRRSYRGSRFQSRTAVETQTELSGHQVCSGEECPNTVGTSLIRTPMGQKKVSLLVKCPYFRG